MNIRLLKKQSYFTGFYPRVLLQSLGGLPVFFRDLIRYQRQNDRSTLRIQVRHLFPILTDRHGSAGQADGHYFHQDLWAAKKIFERRPTSHIDIGSRVDGFVAHLLAFMPVTVLDIRKLESTVAGLTFLQDDATEMRRIVDNSAYSISSLHAAEHFGLGRYSDPVNPQACFAFMRSLERVLAPNGRLYFSVPVGRERVEFNAHRVFAPRTILESFPLLQLVSFSFVSDAGQLIENADPLAMPPSDWACGLFEFTKSPAVSSRDANQG
jgi:hypothetical protein